MQGKDSRRKHVLPLHIDTTSFTSPPQQGTYPWRRMGNKRQLVLITLAFLLLISISLNLRHSYPQPIKYTDPLPFPPFKKYHHAIIVAGHAIYTGSSGDLESDEQWILEPFQKGGQVSTFVAHIRKAIALAKQDPDAIIIFSGGQTRPAAGPTSEGLSYWQVAQKISSDQDTDVRSRMAIEEFARDSHENLLFSICRFSELTGQYPSSVTLVGFEFKRQRFEGIHLKSLRYPDDRFTYVGIDPPGDSEAFTNGEQTFSMKPFERDRYGCQGALKQKKLDRNPFRRRYPYLHSCPDLADLMNFCPADNRIYDGPLPWDRWA